MQRMHDTIQMQIIIHPRSIGDKVIRQKEVYHGERQPWTTSKMQITGQQETVRQIKNSPSRYAATQRGFEGMWGTIPPKFRNSIAEFIQFGNRLDQMENLERKGKIHYKGANNYSYWYSNLLPRAGSRTGERTTKSNDKNVIPNFN